MSAKNRTSSRRSPPPKLDISYLLNNDDAPLRRQPSNAAASSSARHKVNKGQAGHKCPECDATFGEKGNLNRHIKSVQYVIFSSQINIVSLS